MDEKSENVLSSFSDFLKHPVQDVPSPSTTGNKLRVFFLLLIAEVLIVILLQLVFKKLSVIAPSVFENNKVLQFFDKVPVWYAFVIAVLAGPFLEEIFFRLHFRLTGKYLPANFIIVISGALIVSISAIKAISVQITLLAAGIILIVIYLIKREDFNQSILSFWNRKYPYVFYLSVLAFALAHFTNYNHTLISFLLLPVLVLPQFILGICCGYVRLRLGFFWGCLYHSSHNLIILIPLLMLSLSPTHGRHSLFITEQKTTNHINIWKITKDTVEVENGTFIDIMSKLLSTDKEKIEFEDLKVANKVLTIHFQRDPGVYNRTLKGTSLIVMHELLNRYNLKIEAKSVKKVIYELRIIDSVRYSAYNLSDKDPLTTEHVPAYYGDDIVLHNADINLISKTLNSRFNKEIVCYSTNKEKTTITIPSLGFEKMDTFITVHYGLKLYKSGGDTEGYRISPIVK